MEELTEVNGKKGFRDGHRVSWGRDDGNVSSHRTYGVNNLERHDSVGSKDPTDFTV